MILAFRLFFTLGLSEIHPMLPVTAVKLLRKSGYCVQQMMKDLTLEFKEKMAKLFNEWNNGNQIRCYNYRGLGHLARNCTVRPRRRDAAYLQTQLLIGQKEEAESTSSFKEFD
ncbi:gag-pol polyprotein [Tanacetum coccineum]|uniref:Gag-pol polyprotein n=1 Tax=Tanacetum coccineum TaxID=301880 RepID=A0ABQ5EP50_9ASTR